MELTVVTYGGGEVLNNIFNAIAMLINGQGSGIIRPIMVLTASIAGVWAIIKCFFYPSLDTLFHKFLFPLLIITSFLLVPTTNIKVEDVLKNKSYRVDHVPLLFARFTELVSSLGYRITTAVEAVMHVPNDISYNKTGMIFGADTSLDISKYQITNANLEQNMRQVARQCVLYDVMLGRYSIDELKKTTNLWKFLEQNTSNVRMINYIPMDKNTKNRGVYLSCKDAMNKMAPLFAKEKNYYAQHDLIKNLPLTFQALTGLQKEKEELISQQLMMHVLGDEYNSNKFAKSRAHAQQRSTYQILGSLASTSLITMRIVIEALIYAAFIFVLPLSLIPGGIKFISTWVWLSIWIQLWPPFYAILNYIMHSVAHGYANTVFYGLSDPEKGLSLFTSVGLMNLCEDVYALSGYLAASIPFISYAILQGGVSSFIHLAGSMMTPAHSAATNAASEQTTGNYSFANTSFGQTSYGNVSSLQRNHAPSLSTGYITENQGDASVIHGMNEKIIKQNNSDLRTSIFSDDSINQSLQKAEQQAQSFVDTTSNTYMESLSNHGRSMTDLTEHLSKSQNFSTNISDREASEVSQSARFLQSTAENWGKQYGLNARRSMEVLSSASSGVDLYFLSASMGSSLNQGATKEEVASSAINVANSEDFQKNMQNITGISEAKSYSSLNDEGLRLVEGYTRSLDQVQSSQESHQVSLSNMNQVSENASWARNSSDLIKKSLNQDFVNWASDQYADQGGFSRVFDILTQNREPEKDMLVHNFVDHIRTQKCGLSDHTSVDPYSSYQNASQETLNHEHEQSKIYAETIQEATSRGLYKGEVSDESEFLRNQSHIQDYFKNMSPSVQNRIGTEKKILTNEFAEKRDQYLLQRVASGPGGVKEFMAHLDDSQISNLPLHMQGRGDS